MNADAEKLIREVVQQHEAELPHAFQDDPAITEVIVQTFRGRRRWLMVLAYGFTLLGTVLMFSCGYQFFVAAETTKSQIAWAAGFIFFAISTSMTKVWVWGEMGRYSLMREIKRLELVVADLSDRLK